MNKILTERRTVIGSNQTIMLYPLFDLLLVCPRRFCMRWNNTLHLPNPAPIFFAS